MSDTFDFSQTYTADGYGGVAWRATHFETEMVEMEYDTWDVDEHDDEVAVVAWEWVEERTGRVVAHMVGDDRDHSFDTNELTVLDEDDFCHECGQVGCTADGRDRS